jgi:hypothetical protein
MVTSNERCATDETVANYLKVLRFSCIFSLTVYRQLMLRGIFQILEPVLTSDLSKNAVVAEILELMNVLIPLVDEDREEI